MVRHAYHGIGDEHHVQPKVISITQSTEMGTVYQPEEIQALSRFAHERDMYLHLDGRASPTPPPASARRCARPRATWAFDVLCFGGTKNGIMGGEAVSVLPFQTGRRLPVSSQAGHAAGLQDALHRGALGALLTDDLWLANAQHSNRMAKLLEDEVRKIPQVKIVYKVEANGVFAQIPHEALARLQERYCFYVWNEEESIVRWMCSFDTTEVDVREFARFLKETVAK